MSLGLAIMGCGKMGRLIEQLAPAHGFEVRAKFRENAALALGDGEVAALEEMILTLEEQQDVRTRVPDVTVPSTTGDASSTQPSAVLTKAPR